ncbi:DUF2378 family protein [Candidatus Kaiserbacteria bacterium]|nr:DUF2378 family protein [Candidatus Kaiserbacteria bacterium]
MDEAPRPTIKGIFVKSHIRGLERERGAEGLRLLREKFGRPLNYGNGDDVPVADEVQILEHIVDILSGGSLSLHERHLAAGRLHFRNFSTTPLWKIVSFVFMGNTKRILMQSARISGYVFRNVHFISESLDERRVKITMFNNDYPLEHFQGFFQQWIAQADLNGDVEAAAHTRGRYEYTISWTSEH